MVRNPARFLDAIGVLNQVSSGADVEIHRDGVPLPPELGLDSNQQAAQKQDEQDSAMKMLSSTLEQVYSDPGQATFFQHLYNGS